jgi:polyisoprenoid-binding protein YceI
MHASNDSGRHFPVRFTHVIAGLLLIGFGWALSAATAAPKSSGITPRTQSTPSAASELPPPGTYKIDPVHTFVYFSAWHHVVGTVRGRFDKTTGTITVARDPAVCTLDVTIEAFSLSTQFTERDDDLRGPDFFEVTKFPTMTYHGQGIRRSSEGGAWTMDGTLSIRGISKIVPVTFTFKGLFPDVKPGQPLRAAFHATAAAKRGDFNMTRDNPMELGVPPTPGYDVDIQIDVEADAASLKK